MARKKGEGSFSKSGDYHVWEIVIGVNPETGNKRRKVLKNKNLTALKAEVRKYLRDREDEVPSTVGNAITVDAWAEIWLESVRLNRETKTYKSYHGTYHDWIRKRLGKKLMEHVGTSDIQAAVNDAKKAGHDATARYVVVIVRTMLNAARRHSPPYIKHDPCEGVIVPAKKGPRQRVLSHEEVDEFLAELNRYHRYTSREGGRYAFQHRHLARFLLETGLRESEGLGLQEFQIDLNAEPPRVYVAGQLAQDADGKPYIKPYTKGKGDRVVYLSPAAVEAIREQRKETAEYRRLAGDAYDEWALAFPSETGKPIGWRNFVRTIDTVRENIAKKRKRAGLPPRAHWVAHDLRRTFGTRIAQGGAGLKTTQKLMGHKSEATTAKIYVIAEEEDMIRAVGNMKNRKNA